MAVVRKAMLCDQCLGAGCERCAQTGFGSYYAGRVVEVICDARWLVLPDGSLGITSLTTPGMVWQVRRSAAHAGGLVCDCYAHTHRNWCRHLFACVCLASWCRGPAPMEVRMLRSTDAAVITVFRAAQARRLTVPGWFADWCDGMTTSAARIWLVRSGRSQEEEDHVCESSRV